MRSRILTPFLLMTATSIPNIALAEPLTSPTFPGKCVEAFNPSGTLARGATLILANCNGSAAQDFVFDFDNSAFTMPRLSPVLCMDSFGSAINGTGVIMQPCTGSPTQKWRFPWDETIRPAGVDKCLTHFTRAGKPELGWSVDIIIEPNCDFPAEGGGGICLPGAVMFYFEMALWDCHEKGETTPGNMSKNQIWRTTQVAKGGCQGCRATGEPQGLEMWVILAVLMLSIAARRLGARRA